MGGIPASVENPELFIVRSGGIICRLMPTGWKLPLTSVGQTSTIYTRAGKGLLAETLP